MTATFYLGIHRPHWIDDDQFAGVPLCVSRSILADRVSFPRARGPVLFDSSGFTMLQRNGRWVITARQYIAQVYRIIAGLGRMPDAIAPMDAMCEPWVIYGGWHKGIYFHGTRAWRGIPAYGPDESFDAAVFKHLWWTVTNYLLLRRLAPDLPWFPVLQGWELEDYELCYAMYLRAGVDLKALPLVGLGSVCRRQNTAEIGEIVAALAGLGLRLHGFSVKTDGLADYGGDLASADSMAWSYGARKTAPLPGHEDLHNNCANCPEYALQWRSRVLSALATARHAPRCRQPHLIPRHAATEPGRNIA